MRRDCECEEHVETMKTIAHRGDDGKRRDGKSVRERNEKRKRERGEERD